MIASQRAMMTKSGSWRASSAALILPDHLFLGDEALAEHVAAALRPDLVLDVDAGHAGALELAHRAPRVDRVAVAVVGVDDHRNAHRLGDVARVLDHLGHRHQPDVGIPAAHRRARAGHHAQRVAHLLDDPGGQAVVGAAAQHDSGRCQQLPQSSCHAHDAALLR